MDDEIIIEVMRDENSNKNNKKKNNKKKKKNKNQNKTVSSKKEKIDVNEKNIKNTKNQKENEKNKRKQTVKKYMPNAKRRIPKPIIITIITIIVLLLVLSSSLFGIRKIEIDGNQKLTDDSIISLSKLELYQNIFKFNKLEVINNIKDNAYIENVNVSRKLPGTVKITITEREPKYMLQLADSYAYINNQGYILEITTEKLELPILIGISTDNSDIVPGNRINVEDLKKLDKVIKIYETAKSNELSDLITKIDISDDNNYALILEKEGKKVYLGECSNLNTKLLYLKSILENSTGKNGEIFLNVDLNKEHVYFRPSSN